MKAFVVDTNVAVVANGRSRQADRDCVLACVDALDELIREGMIVLDEGSLILNEYRRNLRPSGEPGFGDKFMKWVHIHQAVAARCERVRITPQSAETDDFVGFPDDPALRSFHRDDRKYVAVALASRSNPEMLNAVDPDWWQHRDALARNGVRLRFLCPQHMQ